MNKETAEKNLSSLMAQRDNNFNLIRLIAATSVLISHSYALLGQSEPLENLLGVNLGNLSVYIFFATSGFLLTNSLSRNHDVYRFIKARSLRIFPALWVMLAITIILFGLIFRSSDLLGYLIEKPTIRYIAYNSSLIFGIAYTIPSIHGGSAINGSLWSLRPELQMYIGLLALLVISRFCTALSQVTAGAIFHWGVVATFATCVIAGTFSSIDRHGLIMLGGMFFGGSTICLTSKHVTPRTGIAILGAALLLLLSHQISILSILMIALPLATITAAYLPSRILFNYNRLGDYSYGIYLYAFPIQKLLIWFRITQQPIEMIIYAALAALAFAVLSWHLVEKPALRLK
jgi:peptidoglycan/LPS O-acetylase OafA/YrhL